MGTKKKTTKQITVFSGVLIRNNKVLLAQRFEPACKDAHLKWEFPGGKVDFGETPKKAVKREFSEETGIEVLVGELLPNVWTNYWEYKWGTQQTLCFLYICTFIKQTTVSKDHHIEKIAWVGLDEVQKLQTLPGTEEILKIVTMK